MLLCWSGYLDAATQRARRPTAALIWAVRKDRRAGRRITWSLGESNPDSLFARQKC